MVKMRFHWEGFGTSGSFTVESFSVEDCIKTAEEEIEEHGSTLVDYYEI